MFHVIRWMIILNLISIYLSQALIVVLLSIGCSMKSTELEFGMKSTKFCELKFKGIILCFFVSCFHFD